jgi:hypothetical protein
MDTQVDTWLFRISRDLDTPEPSGGLEIIRCEPDAQDDIDEMDARRA